MHTMGSRVMAFNWLSGLPHVEKKDDIISDRYQI